jgi:hypothetical protein
MIAVEKAVSAEDGIRILCDIKEASDAIAVGKLSFEVRQRKGYVQVFLFLGGEVQIARTRGTDARLLH